MFFDNMKRKRFRGEMNEMPSTDAVVLLKGGRGLRMRTLMRRWCWWTLLSIGCCKSYLFNVSPESETTWV